MKAPSLIQKMWDKFPMVLKDTAFLRSFGLMKVPMLFYISPVVLECNEERCQIKIPLNYRTKNHLNCMYFGSLAAGADCAGGLMAMRIIQKSGAPVSLLFKDFKADFLKRAEGDVVFSCSQGREISDFMEKALQSGERINMPVNVTATVPSKLGSEPVAQFVLTLSVKRKISPA